MEQTAPPTDRELVARAISRCFAHWTVGFTPMSTNRVLQEVRSKVGWTTVPQDEIVGMIEQHAVHCGIPVASDVQPI